MFSDRYRFLSIEDDLGISIFDRTYRFIEQNIGSYILSIKMALYEPDLSSCVKILDVGEFRFYIDKDFYYIVRFGKDTQEKLVAFSNSKFRTVYLYNINKNNSNYVLDIIYYYYRWFLITTKSFLNIHSSAVIFRNSAVLFVGESGAGKSTQAKLWQKYTNSWVLNYDKPTLIVNHNEILVAGSPWGGKENYINNRIIPLKCFVNIIQDKENRIEDATQEQEYMLLHRLFDPILINKTMTDNYESLLKIISSSIKMYHLYCTPDEESVMILYSYLFGDYKEERRIQRMKIKNNYIIRKVVDDWIVIPRGENSQSMNCAFVTNDIGAFMWKQLESQCTFSQLIESVISEYEIDVDCAKHDCESFIQKLKEYYLIEVND